MENPYSSPSSNLQGGNTFTGTVNITVRVAEVMRFTQKWVRVVASFAIVGTLLNIFGVLSENSGEFGRSSATMVGAFIGLLIQIVISLVLIVKLFGYASRIGDMLRSGSMLDLEAALGEHRKFWKISGIYLIVMIGFMLLALGLSTSRF